MRRVTLPLGAVLLSNLLPLAASGEAGPCGVALGTWTIDQHTCDQIKSGDSKLGGQDAYITFGSGGKWVQWESICQIRDSVFNGGICTVGMSCSVEGSASKETLRLCFGME